MILRTLAFVVIFFFFLNLYPVWTSSCFIYELSFYADLGALGNYPGSPFMQSDSDILLESSDQKDIGKCAHTHTHMFICMYVLFLIFKFNQFGEWY